MVLVYILAIIVVIILIFTLFPLIIFGFTFYKLITYFLYKYNNLSTNTDEKVKLFSISFVALIISNLFLSNFDLSWKSIYPDPLPSWLISFLISANISTIIGILILRNWSKKIELRDELIERMKSLKIASFEFILQGDDFFKQRNYQSAIDKWNYAKSNLNQVLILEDRIDVDINSIENTITETENRIYKAVQLLNEQEEIKNLIDETDIIIENIIRYATNAKNSLWLTTAKMLYIENQKISQEFEDGRILYIDAKAHILDLKKQAEILNTLPPNEEITNKNSKKEQTYYDILGVNPKASISDIRKAYHAKIKQYHHDTTAKWTKGTLPEWFEEHVHEMSIKLNDAYTVLRDEDKRREYDKKIGM